MLFLSSFFSLNFLISIKTLHFSKFAPVCRCLKCTPRWPALTLAPALMGTPLCTPPARPATRTTSTETGTSREFSALRGQCHKIFFFRFFLWIILPQAPENIIRVISNKKIRGDIRKWRWTTSINDTGGAPWAANILREFSKKLKRLGGNWFKK